MKILITGGAGFIGSHLSEKLMSKGHDVITVDNFNDFYSPSIKEDNVKNLLKNDHYTLHRCDIRDYQTLDSIFDSHQIDVIVHLAAMAGVRPSIENPLLYEDVNLKGTQTILEVARKNNVDKLVLASSSSVYGNNKEVPFKETDIVDYAISPYAATKKSNEVMGHVYHHLYHMNMIFLRFFTVYGPRQRPDLAIHKFTKLIDEGQAIPYYGDGSTSRDYTYIDDIVEGVMQSIDYVVNHEGVYEIINLGESEPITLSSMVTTIEEALGKKATLHRLPMQLGDVERTFADISKAKQLLGYHPHTSFREGIKKFVEWYQESKKIK